MLDTILECKNIRYAYNKKTILQDISFKIKKNEMVSIVGLNGAGKSSICKILAGINKATSGILLKNKNLKISYIPQISNIYNITIPLKLLNFITLYSKKNLDNQDFEIIEKLKIIDLLHQDIKSLSGGELQKAFLARSLIKKPDLLILDEPLSAIDFSMKAEIYNLISEIKNKYNFATIMVSHDINLVFKDTNWVLCIQNGKIGCQGNLLQISKNNNDLLQFENNWKFYQHIKN